MRLLEEQADCFCHTKRWGSQQMLEWASMPTFSFLQAHKGGSHKFRSSQRPNWSPTTTRLCRRGDSIFPLGLRTLLVPLSILNFSAHWFRVASADKVTASCSLLCHSFRQITSKKRAQVALFCLKGIMFGEKFSTRVEGNFACLYASSPVPSILLQEYQERRSVSLVLSDWKEGFFWPWRSKMKINLFGKLFHVFFSNFLSVWDSNVPPS